jgi:spermidine/putrescine transport system ATP-binding protein
LERRINIAELRDVSKKFHNEVILQDFNLSIKHGEFLTLLGPSGCGKTTILRLLAGFEHADSGEVIIDDRIVNNIPPHKRQVNTVFQNYALFPHLSVFENIAFGLKMEKAADALIKEEVARALDIVKLQNYGSRYPHQLSGGQQQRVAIARAIVKKPHILLLDEPFSALDLKLRQQMQVELKHIQRNLGITFVFVTHDQEEALSMSDRVVVINKGEIEQIGTPKNVYEEPRTLFVANFIGEANIFEGAIKAITKDKLKILIEGIKYIRTIAKKSFKNNEPVKVVVRPEDIRLNKWREVSNSKNQLFGHIQTTTYKGATVNSIIQLENGKIISASQFFDETHDSFNYRVGERVAVDWVQGWEVVLHAEE